MSDDCHVMKPYKITNWNIFLRNLLKVPAMEASVQKKPPTICAKCCGVRFVFKKQLHFSSVFLAFILIVVPLLQ